MIKKSVTIELDKARDLRYGINSLVKIEDLTGKPISKLDLDNISMKDLRSIVYAGLYHEDNNLTPETVGDLIDEHGTLDQIAIKLGEAFALAFGDNEKNAVTHKVK